VTFPLHLVLSFGLTHFPIVSVAQKTVGYQNAPGFPFTAPLVQALDFVDSSLGKVVAKLKANNLYDDTLIIVASKHGQNPIDPSKYKKIDPKAVTNATKVDVVFQTVCFSKPRVKKTSS
jgi:predicted AlkP superfamily pyrophosphatase or phosphodiesterase